MKHFVWALICAAGLAMCGVAQADQTQVGAAFVLASGTHTEAGGTTRGSVPVPILFVAHRVKRWEFRAEGMLGLGPQQLSNNPYGLNSTELSYASASARFALTPNTAIGIGETLYNQRSLYQGVGYTQTDVSRLVGAQYQIAQTLRRSLHGSLDLTVAYNPHMTANLLTSISNTPPGVGAFVSPESGTQIDMTLGARRQYHRTTLGYGVRYINLTMHFVDGVLADRNAFLMPYVGVSTSLGR